MMIYKPESLNFFLLSQLAPALAGLTRSGNQVVIYNLYSKHQFQEGDLLVNNVCVETPRSPVLMIFAIIMVRAGSNDIIDIFFTKLTTTGDADITRPTSGLFVLLFSPLPSLLPPPPHTRAERA